MPDPIRITTRQLDDADAEMISSFYPVPGLGLVPINAFVLRAAEPVLVDTGYPVMKDAYLQRSNVRSTSVTSAGSGSRTSTPTTSVVCSRCSSERLGPSS